MPKHKRHKKKHKNEADKAATTKAHEARQTDQAETHIPPPTEASAESDVAPDEGAETAEREALAAEALEMRSLAQRTRAEFENYRKRVERERADTANYAATSFLKEILPVLDNLERAVEAAASSGDDVAGDDQLRQGVEIVTKQFRDTLVRQGLSEVEAEGAPFDPHVHEAVHKVETNEYPGGTVVSVLQKGYTFKGRLLRPAMVSVAHGAEDTNAEAEPNRENEGEAVP